MYSLTNDIRDRLTTPSDPVHIGICGGRPTFTDSEGRVIEPWQFGRGSVGERADAIDYYPPPVAGRYPSLPWGTVTVPLATLTAPHQ